MYKKIRTIGELLERVHDFTGSTVIFRGVDRSWKMLPTITRSFCRHRLITKCGILDQQAEENTLKDWFDRGIPEGSRDEMENYERTMFKSFKRQAMSYRMQRPNTDWEWIAIAQHNELPTRLLDWTKNPLAAAYFSVAGQARTNKDTFIYAMKFGELTQGGESMIDLESPPKVSPLDYEERDGFDRFVPPVIDARIAAQQSVFTVCHPCLRITELAADKIEIITLDVDASRRRQFRADLQRLGVNGATLFPDLVSFCRNQKWVWEEYRHSGVA